MIQITILLDQKKRIFGFLSENHAGFSESGTDIICAAVSMLTINTMNAIEQFTGDDFLQEADPETARIRFEIRGEVSKEAELLLKTMVLGLQSLEDDDNYSAYIDVVFKEV